MQEEKKYMTFYTGILNSYSQVFFSTSPLLAWIILIVTFLDIITGLSGLFSILVTNGIAWVMGFNRNKIRNGYYGFNSLLVGLGLGIFFQLTPEFMLILAAAAIFTLFLTLMLEGVIGKYYLPYLSIPFILSAWTVVLATRGYSSLFISERGIYFINDMYVLGGMTMVRIYEWFNALEFPESLEIYFRSIGAIFFQYNLLPGILLAIGLLIYSRIAFILSLVGFYAAFAFYKIVGADPATLNYTYIGFNFILTAIAVGGYFVIPSRYSFLWVILLTPIIAIILNATTTLFSLFQLSIYSLPFNIVVLLFLYGLKFREKYYHRPELVLFQQFSPEKNLYLQLNNRQRFGEFPHVLASLPFWGEWTVTQGHNGQITHKDAWRHAWDFEILDREGKSWRNSGNVPEDYFCFDKPVIAPADGWIESVTNGIDDNDIGQVNLEHNWGNTIVIKHTEKLYSALSHLKKGSIAVHKGDYVNKGDVIARCGNSGRSPVPHLHMQFQSSPQVGSQTLDFPLSYYLLNERNSYLLKTYERPGQDEVLCNIERNDLLKSAFSFFPGQHLSWSVRSDNGTEERIDWEVHTDIYNNTYLFCRETSSKAWFKQESDMFYFTHFQGNKHSYLYYFFLGTFRVAFGFYRNMKVKDTYPANVMAKGPWLFLQDLIAPFLIFINSKFRLEYIKASDDLAEKKMHLKSEALITVVKSRARKISFDLEFSNDMLEKMVIHEPDKPTRTLLCEKPS